MSDHPARPAPEVGRLDLRAAYRLLAAGMLLWTLALAVRWPLALSFGDEVGYVGQAKLFLAGKVRPEPESPGVWVTTPQGPRAQYPLLVPALMAPFVAASPRLVFLTGVAAALAIAFVAGRVLAAWGRSPAYGLVVLLHPTVTLIARTAMSDLMLAAFSVGAWWAVRRDRRGVAFVLLAFTVAAKPIGFLLALAIVVGEALHLGPELRAGERSARRRVAAAAAGMAAGLALLLALNVLAADKLWFDYDHRFLGTPPFWFKYFPTSAPRHALSLLLVPPLLAAGAWPFWRRRDFGPLLVIVGLTGMMCFYFFVDTGRSTLETLVLAPRLILPVVAFLLIGWADLLAGAAGAFPRLRRALPAVLVVAPALLAFAISVRHRRWQEPEAEALAAAERLVAARGEHELGSTAESVKIALLYPGPTPSLREGAPARAGQPGVVLCGTRSWSYRTGDVAIPCSFPGYTVESERDGFQLLVRTNAQ
jgi:hypothetical protein